MDVKPTSIGRRQALALAAVLTLAVGTGAAAVAGLARPPSTPVGGPAIVLPAAHAPAPTREVDD